jgi:O-methyltransferase
MGWKNKMFQLATSSLCNVYYRRHKEKVHLALNMSYDTVKKPLIDTIQNVNTQDYCRYRALELIAEEIYRYNIKGSVAEAGVANGEFAALINRAFPDRKLYLYDTFEGFNELDKKYEIENNYTSEQFFTNQKDFRGKGREKNIEGIRLRMQHVGNCIFRKGYFPESAISDIEETFAFVSIDMDLYKPIFAALQFFYPRLNQGGIIFLHDYNHREFKGIKIAIEEFENINGKLNKVPLPDQGGTLVIIKN